MTPPEVTHNVGMGRRRGGAGSDDYLDFLRSLSNMETTVATRGSGMSISYKRS